MNAFIALVRKDLILYFSNRRSVLVSIVAPIIIGGFFGYVFGGNNDSEMSAIAINVVDLDQSAISKDLVANLQKDAHLSVTPSDAATADASVRAGKSAAAIVIPSDFGKQASRALFAGPPRPQLEVTYDPSQKMALQIVQGLLAQQVMQSVSKAMFTNPAAAFPDFRQRVANSSNLDEGMRHDLNTMFDSIERVGKDGAATATPAAVPTDDGTSASSGSPASGSIGSTGLTLPYTVASKEASSRPEVVYNAYGHSFAGMGVQFILFMGIDIGIALLTMRRMDIWKRLKAAPLSKATLLASRMTSCAIIAVIIFTIILSVAVLAFGVHVSGSLVGLAAMLVMFSVMTASFGLMIAALGRSPEATRGLAIVVTMIMVMLGGAWVPAFIFPKWLQQVSLLVPTRWAVDGFDNMIWRGLPVESIFAPLGVLLGFTLAFSAIALLRFDWDE